MVNNVYDLVTRTMEQEFPGRVAFRWVEDATGTVKEKTYAEYAQDIRRAAAWFARNIPEVEGKRVPRPIPRSGASAPLPPALPPARPGRPPSAQRLSAEAKFGKEMQEPLDRGDCILI